MTGCLYGRRDSLGKGGDNVVAPEYLFGPTLQLPLEERYAVAEVGDGLVFGFQQGVHARLQDARGLVDGNGGGRRGGFAVTLCRVLTLWSCGCWAWLFLSADGLWVMGIPRPREGLWGCYVALRAIHRGWTFSTVNNP